MLTFVPLLVVGVTAPALAADFGYRGGPIGPMAIPPRAIVVPDCEDRRSLRAFRCIENRVLVNQDEEPWVDRVTTIPGYRGRPYQRLFERPWGR